MSSRADRLADVVRERELDAVLVTAMPNVRWLTGFTGTSGMAIVGPDVRVFLTDFRYVSQAAEQVDASFDRHLASGELVTAVGEHLAAGASRVGFDDQNMSVASNRRLAEGLGDGIELVGAGGAVEDLRAVKDDDEVRRLRGACELADAALGAVLEDGLAGRTETEIALALEIEQRRLGASGSSFPAIVASGAHGALPHAVARDVEIAPDVLVTIDWGCVLDGYCSDCTRTFATGDSVAQAALDGYALVLAAQQAGLDGVRAGVNGREVDAQARAVIDAAGHADHFGHGLGHGVGLEIHEAPRLSPLAPETPLLAGQAVTVEPGIYVPGEFGIRIEDLVIVTDAAPLILTTGLSKQLTVV